MAGEEKRQEEQRLSEQLAQKGERLKSAVIATLKEKTDFDPEKNPAHQKAIVDLETRAKEMRTQWLKELYVKEYPNKSENIKNLSFVQTMEHWASRAEPGRLPPQVHSLKGKLAELTIQEIKNWAAANGLDIAALEAETEKGIVTIAAHPLRFVPTDKAEAKEAEKKIGAYTQRDWQSWVALMNAQYDAIAHEGKKYTGHTHKTDVTHLIITSKEQAVAALSKEFTAVGRKDLIGTYKDNWYYAEHSYDPPPTVSHFIKNARSLDKEITQIDFYDQAGRAKTVVLVPADPTSQRAAQAIFSLDALKNSLLAVDQKSAAKILHSPEDLAVSVSHFLHERWFKAWPKDQTLADWSGIAKKEEPQIALNADIIREVSKAALTLQHDNFSDEEHKTYKGHRISMNAFAFKVGKLHEALNAAAVTDQERAVILQAINAHHKGPLPDKLLTDKAVLQTFIGIAHRQSTDSVGAFLKTFQPALKSDHPLTSYNVSMQEYIASISIKPAETPEQVKDLLKKLATEYPKATLEIRRVENPYRDIKVTDDPVHVSIHDGVQRHAVVILSRNWSQDNAPLAAQSLRRDELAHPEIKRTWQKGALQTLANYAQAVTESHATALEKAKTEKIAPGTEPQDKSKTGQGRSVIPPAMEKALQQAQVALSLPASTTSILPLLKTPSKGKSSPG